jgi:hypothetical protein
VLAVDNSKGKVIAKELLQAEQDIWIVRSHIIINQFHFKI